MTGAWRCFVALALPDGLRLELADAVKELRREDAALDGAWRWSDASQWHVTLAFLGATDPAARWSVEAAVRDVAAATPAFRLTTGELGAFPGPGAARVIWYGVDDPGGRLRRLATDLRRALGVDDGSPFHPHVTLARSRLRHPTSAVDLLRGATVPSGQLHVDRALLYRSHLGSGPPRYELLAAEPLAPAGEPVRR